MAFGGVSALLSPDEPHWLRVSRTRLFIITQPPSPLLHGRCRKWRPKRSCPLVITSLLAQVGVFQPPHHLTHLGRSRFLGREEIHEVTKFVISICLFNRVQDTFHASLEVIVGSQGDFSVIMATAPSHQDLHRLGPSTHAGEATLAGAQ
eukprot:CAMPEP_0194490980 /NCGR_PEP_ID=MMETSP0253-20130528/10014_1 /TAXON_ID=2966 /ORGANISM="Noctiluca scintillans" /LENGTH=148 /DNA_ID=CAMNT_0039331665 /DNA_START=414 /DNA_END=857 /DNA_ORIENTATION=+